MPKFDCGIRLAQLSDFDYRTYIRTGYLPGFFAMNIDEVFALLKEKSNPAYLAGMKRFGIDNAKALGIPLPELRKLSKTIKRDHNLAQQLWKTGVHEARLLATMIADAAQITPRQADDWVNDLRSWDVCDQLCGNLLCRTPFAMEKVIVYSTSADEFTKRAGFVLMTEMAVHLKAAPNNLFTAFLPIIEREAWDGRNFVKKAVSWALRQIGKRNGVLRTQALATADSIFTQNSKPAKWIAKDAIKELEKTEL